MQENAIVQSTDILLYYFMQTANPSLCNQLTGDFVRKMTK